MIISSRDVVFAVEVWPLDFAWGGNGDVKRLVRIQRHRRYIPSSYADERCFRVNFQMKNAATPSSAIPPATDNPTIDPVPSPEFESASWLLGGGVGVGEVLEPVFET